MTTCYTIAIIALAVLFTLWLKRTGRAYDLMMLLTAGVAGFFMAEAISVQYWYYHLPILGLTTMFSLFMMAVLLFFFGTHKRRIKNSLRKNIPRRNDQP